VGSQIEVGKASHNGDDPGVRVQPRINGDVVMRDGASRFGIALCLLLRQRVIQNDAVGTRPNDGFKVGRAAIRRLFLYLW